MSASTRLLSYPDHRDVFVVPNGQSVVSLFEELLKPLHLTLAYSCTADQLDPTHGFLHLFTSTDGSHATLRGYKSSGLITLDLQEWVNSEATPRFDDGVVTDLEKRVMLALCKAQNGHSEMSEDVFPAIRRGERVKNYYPLVDGRLVEYDFTEEVFSKRTQYQHIVISHSPTLGNVLILDGDVNLGESDLVYSETLMQSGKVQYRGMNCLILGGGDGGLLHKILKQGPSMVTMIDLDEGVVEACRTHLRGVCGDSMDSLKGPNHEIIIGDAVGWLKAYSESGEKFDRVLYDLTAIPIKAEAGEGEDGDLWDFIATINKLAFKVLAQGGVYLAQVNAKSARGSVEAYESMLRGIDPGLAWRAHEAFVPSYHEYWVFFEVWRRSECNNIES